MIVTHLNRDYDNGHTSWAEIQAFADLLNCQALDKKQIDLKNYSKVFAFLSGEADKEFVKQLELSNVKLFIVIQDPNWKTHLTISKEYVLITPFKRFDPSMIDIKGYSQMIYVPMGVMLALSNWYQNQYANAISMCEDYFQLIQKYKSHEICYAGSLKEDRKLAMGELGQRHCHFFGNFTREMFENFSLLKVHPRAKFPGRTPVSYVIPEIYKLYNEVAFLSDEKMSKLRVSHIRFYEMMLSQSKVRLFGNTLNDLIEAKEWLKEYAHEIEENIFIFQKEAFNDDIQQLKQVIEYIKKI